MLSGRKAILLAGVVGLVAIVVASLIPANMQIRLGLHWLIEHFLIFFVTTAIFCRASQKPLLVGGLMMLVSPTLEAIQGLTPDRTPDLQTALSGAAGALSGALFVKAVTVSWRRRPKAPEAA